MPKYPKVITLSQFCDWDSEHQFWKLCDKRQLFWPLIALGISSGKSKFKFGRVFSAAAFLQPIISNGSVTAGLAGWTSCVVLSLDFDRKALTLYLPSLYWSLACLTNQTRKEQRLLNGEPFHMCLSKHSILQLMSDITHDNKCQQHPACKT